MLRPPSLRLHCLPSPLPLARTGDSGYEISTNTTLIIEHWDVYGSDPDTWKTVSVLAQQATSVGVARPHSNRSPLA